MTHLPGFAGVFVRDTPATLWVPSPSRSQEKGNTCQGAREQEQGEGALWEEKTGCRIKKDMDGIERQKVLEQDWHEIRGERAKPS